MRSIDRERLERARPALSPGWLTVWVLQSLSFHLTPIESEFAYVRCQAQSQFDTFSKRYRESSTTPLSARVIAYLESDFVYRLTEPCNYASADRKFPSNRIPSRGEEIPLFAVLRHAVRETHILSSCLQTTRCLLCNPWAAYRKTLAC